MKIHLTQQARIRHKRLRNVVDTASKVTPHHIPGHVEQKGGRAVSRQSSHPAEDEGEDECGKQWANHVPGWAKDRLFVDRDKIAPDKQADEIAVAPQLAQSPVEPPPVR